MQQHLSAGQPGTTSGGAAKKHMSRSLLYTLLFTVHAATGKTGTNLLLKLCSPSTARVRWEKDNLKLGPARRPPGRRHVGGTTRRRSST